MPQHAEKLPQRTSCWVALSHVAGRNALINTSLLVNLVIIISLIQIMSPYIPYKVLLNTLNSKFIDPSSRNFSLWNEVVSVMFENTCIAYSCLIFFFHTKIESTLYYHYLNLTYHKLYYKLVLSSYSNNSILKHAKFSDTTVITSSSCCQSIYLQIENIKYRSHLHELTSQKISLFG